MRSPSFFKAFFKDFLKVSLAKVSQHSRHPAFCSPKAARVSSVGVLRVCVVLRVCGFEVGLACFA